MTEYDYSPGAYERHLAKQQGIAGWVDDTLRHPQANPFVPSASSTTSTFRAHSVHSSSRHHAPTSHHTASPTSDLRHMQRPPNARTYSSPSTPEPSEAAYDQPRSLHYSSSAHPRSSRHRSTHRSTRSASVSVPNTASSGTVPYTTVYPDPSSPTIITQSPTQPIVMPINGGAGGYYIVPPRGRRMEVISPQYGYGYQQNGYQENGYPEKKEGHSFFNKLLHSFSSGESKSSRRSKSTHHRRRSRRDSY